MKKIPLAMVGAVTVATTLSIGAASAAHPDPHLCRVEATKAMRQHERPGREESYAKAYADCMRGAGGR